MSVILSEAKELQVRSGKLMQILRPAQNDRLSRERSEGSALVRIAPELQTLRFAQGDRGGLRAAAKGSA